MTTPLSTQSNLYRRYRFFKENGGYCVGSRAISAVALARAEQWAEDNDIDYTWEWDTDGDLGDHACWCRDERRREAGYSSFGMPESQRRLGQCAHEIEACVLEYQGEVLASLCGIIDADRTYRRVVEAELALEAMQDAKHFVYY
jgi:hypothetical protein